MTAATPATVEVFKTVFREGRPIVLMFKLPSSLLTSVPVGLRQAVDETDIGGITLTARGGRMKSW
jgi:hypothetical protein